MGIARLAGVARSVVVYACAPLRLRSHRLVSRLGYRLQGGKQRLRKTVSVDAELFGAWECQTDIRLSHILWHSVSLESRGRQANPHEGWAQGAFPSADSEDPLSACSRSAARAHLIRSSRTTADPKAISVGMRAAASFHLPRELIGSL